MLAKYGATVVSLSLVIEPKDLWSRGKSGRLWSEKKLG